jgi:Zn-dependent peptidase ImmA (M78 family)
MPPKEVILNFRGKLVGTKQTQQIVAETISKLPWQMIEYIVDHVWFLSSTDDAWAFTFNGNDVKDKHFIFLSDELLRESEQQIHFTVLHELGHIILQHQNSIGYKQTKDETNKQEKEADEFAKKYLD